MEYILLNLLFLIFGIFVYVIFFLNKKIERENRELFVWFFSSVAIFICKTFPIPVFSETIFGIICIPFILGSIYGGRKVAVALFVTINIISIFENNEHLLTSFLINLTMLITILWLINSIYDNLSKIKKVIVTMILIVLFTVLKVVFFFDLFIDEVLLNNYQLFLLFGLTKAFSVGILVYISEYIKEITIIQKEYQETDKLKVVSELAASVSHEVRNPLTVTRGFIQLLYDPNIDNEKKELYLNLSLQELDRAQSIISDYLTFAKPLEFSNFKMLNLSKEIEYLFQVISPLAQNQGVVVKKEGAADCCIIGDKHKFRQCLINVMKNGIEAMPDGGTLTISVKTTGKEVSISIIDSGVGMSEEQIAKLGSPFNSEKEKGTGLGTMVVYSVVRSMNGTISVTSKVGIGTTFTFVFPIIIED